MKSKTAPTSVHEKNAPDMVQLFKVSGTSEDLELKFAGEVFKLIMERHNEAATKNTVDQLIYSYAKADPTTYPENSALRGDKPDSFDKSSGEYKQLQSTVSNVLRKLRTLGLVDRDKEGKNVFYSLHQENLTIYVKAIEHMNQAGSSESIKRELPQKSGELVEQKSKDIITTLHQDERGTAQQYVSLMELKLLAKWINMLDDRKTHHIFTMLKNPEKYTNSSVSNGNKPQLGLTVQEIEVNKIRGKKGQHQAVISNWLGILKDSGFVNYRGTEEPNQQHQGKEHYYYLTDGASERFEEFFKIFCSLQSVASPQKTKKSNTIRK